MTDAPLVSVIVPAYQAERFIRETLESALAQDYAPVEIIVVDDGSDDGTAQIAASLPVRLVRIPHSGVSAARNAGIAAARGDYVTILDADDLWPVDRLSHQVTYLQQHREHGIVVGLTSFFLTPGEPRPAHWPRFPDGAAVPGHAGTMLARRAAFEIVGCYDETLALCEDIDWLARAKDAGITTGTVEQVLLHYRIHANNSSRQAQANVAVLLGVLRKTVRRQREASR
jgi:glycosyltransferase involved in cell wall biosynthesis